MQKSSTNMVFVGVIVLLVAAGYFAMTKKSSYVDKGESTSTTKDETPGLKTYISTNLEYSVSYPADWVIDKNNYGEDIHPSEKDLTNPLDETFFNISLDTSQSNPILVRTFEEVRQSEKKNFGGRDRTESEITFGGEKAYTYVEKFFDKSYEVIVQHDKKIYIIWTQRYDLNDVKQIFSTFKFTK